MSIGKQFGGIGVVVAMSLLTVWPFMVDHGSIAAIGSDGWFIATIIGKQATFYSDLFRSLGGTFYNIFQANIFYPNTLTLAYSDMFFVSGLVGFFGRFVGLEWQSLWSWVLVAGQVGTGVVCYWWYRKLGAGRVASWLGTLAVLTSVIHLHYVVHLHTWNMTWWLLGSGLMVFGLRDQRRYQSILGAVLLGSQFWEAPMGGFFGLALVVIWGGRYRKQIVWTEVVRGGMALMLVALPALLVYRQVAVEQAFVRSIRDAAHGGMSLNELVTKFWSWSFVLPLVASWWWLQNQQKSGSRTRKFLLAVGGVGVVMALGPVLKWSGETVKFFGLPLPLPYTLAYYMIPGFQGFREPSRWITLLGWAVGGMIAVRMTGVDKGKLYLMICVLLVMGVFQVGQIPRTALYTEQTLPGVYQWLAQRSEARVWEVPMGGDEVESKRMYTTLFTRATLINGFSGFIPQKTQELQKTSRVVTPALWQHVPADVMIIHRSDTEFSTYVTEFANQIQYKDETSIVVGR